MLKVIIKASLLEAEPDRQTSILWRFQRLCSFAFYDSFFFNASLERSRLKVLLLARRNLDQQRHEYINRFLKFLRPSYLILMRFWSPIPLPPTHTDTTPNEYIPLFPLHSFKLLKSTCLFSLVFRLSQPSVETWSPLVVMSPHSKRVGTDDVMSEHSFPRVDLRLSSCEAVVSRGQCS